jgi:hypothetical protein
MANITFGSLVSDVRGSIGNVIYSRSASGPTIRLKSSKPWQDSARRTVAREQLTECTATWRNMLSSAERTAWRHYAATLNDPGRMGKPITRSGYNAFIASYWYRYLAGPISWHAAPTRPGHAGAVAIRNVEAPGGLNYVAVSIDPTYVDTQSPYTAVFLHISNPHSPTRYTFQGRLRLSDTVHTGDPEHPIGYDLLFDNPWGTNPYEGKARIWVKLVVLHPDNRLSPKEWSQALTT